MMDHAKRLILDRMPLICVFLSGIGFSIQALTVKMLSEQGFHGSFQFIFARGFVQMALSVIFICFDRFRSNGDSPKLFGDTNRVRSLLFLRSMAGFCGIAFAFLALELIPLGDSTVLMMLSPLIASIASYFVLGEPWLLPEFCATIFSLTGAVLVIKPPLMFGTAHTSDPASFYLGVSFALIAALAAGFAYIFVRILGTTASMPWANVCLAQALGQIVLSLPSAYLFHQPVTWNISTSEWLIIFGSAALGAVSQVLMTLGMQREKSAAATAMRMSDVVFGFIWQSLFTQDAVSVLSVIGAVLVSSSILIVVVFKQKTLPVITTAAISSEIEHKASKVTSNEKRSRVAQILSSKTSNRFVILNDSDDSDVDIQNEKVAAAAAADDDDDDTIDIEFGGSGSTVSRDSEITVSGMADASVSAVVIASTLAARAIRDSLHNSGATIARYITAMPAEKLDEQVVAEGGYPASQMQTISNSSG